MKLYIKCSTDYDPYEAFSGECNMMFNINPAVRRQWASDTSDLGYINVYQYDPNEFVRAAVAHNPNTPAANLREMSDDKSVEVKEALADNPNTPGDVLVKLFTEIPNFDENSDWIPEGPDDGGDYVGVVANICRNPNLPIDWVRKLFAATHWYVRSQIACRSDIPLDALISRVDKEKDSDVIYNLIHNSSVPDYLKDRLDPEWRENYK